MGFDLTGLRFGFLFSFRVLFQSFIGRENPGGFHVGSDRQMKLNCCRRRRCLVSIVIISPLLFNCHEDVTDPLDLGGRFCFCWSSWSSCQIFKSLLLSPPLPLLPPPPLHLLLVLFFYPTHFCCYLPFPCALRRGGRGGGRGRNQIIRGKC